MTDWFSDDDPLAESTPPVESTPSTAVDRAVDAFLRGDAEVVEREMRAAIAEEVAAQTATIETTTLDPATAAFLGLDESEPKREGAIDRVIAQRAARKADAAPTPSTSTHDAITLDPSQERAVELLCTAPVGVVTGGAGCGKTTCLRVALDRLDAAGVSYALAAPTGKAAKRISEATGRPASTIHRLLEYGPKGSGFTMGFARNATNPLDFDVVIVDEASMLDVELGEALCDALREVGDDTPWVESDARIVFIGDAQQLPSVGPGRFLADLIVSGEIPVARLTQVHRAAAESWICTEAPKVLRGEWPDLTERHDFRFVETDAAEDAIAAILELAEKFAADGTTAQVLTPQKNTALGTETLNRALQDTLNPLNGRRVWDGASKLRVGDRVIQTRNDYTRFVFNGEIGEVVSFDALKLFVRFDDRVVEYSKDASDALHLAYALTVHKYQGSEVPWAIVVAHGSHQFMQSRQLLYTALTRAKKGVVMVGNRKGVEAALKDASPSQRNTELAELIKAEFARGSDEEGEAA